MEVNEILKECKSLVEEICQKFGYSTQDIEGNDSLKTVLLKVIPIMLKDSNQEERNLFYQMLSHTPIIITENLTQETYDKLLEQYIGKDINQHIIGKNIELGEYGKSLGAGAYVYELILDENLKVQGKKSFIYIEKIAGNAKELLGTDINVSHLIHELGHAWHAEKNQYIMKDDGTLIERIGTAEFRYSFSKTPDNKFVKKCTKTTGLMIEESMNTHAEEVTMANYLGISLEEMQKKYGTTLERNNYQGYMVDFVSYMLEQLGKDDFEHYRLYGDIEIKNKINELMEQTNYWKNRETDILPSTDSPRSYDKKRKVLDKINNSEIRDFFKGYETIYFPDISKMSPLEKIDNVLEQKFNINMLNGAMDFDIYAEFMDRLGYEGYSLINQAAELANSKKKKEFFKKEITPAETLKNALKSGVTLCKSNEVNGVEQSELNQKNNEGVTKDD